MDNTPYYCVPAALNFRNNLCGGEEAIYTYIRDVAQRGADLCAMVLGTEVMDDLDTGEGLKTMGSYEGGDRREGGRTGWAGGLRDCAMANVLLPLTIAGAVSQGSLSLGPGGAGSAGGLGLSPHIRSKSYSLTPSQSSSLGPSSNTSAPWIDPIRRPSSPFSASPYVSSPNASPKLTAMGPVIILQEDVAQHVQWMQKTLIDEYHTFVAIYDYNGKIWTRISGQIYLELKDFEWLGGVLKKLCERVRAGESLRAPEESYDLQLSKTRTQSVIDLETLGRSASTMSLGTPGGGRRFDVTRGGWVEA